MIDLDRNYFNTIIRQMYSIKICYAIYVVLVQLYSTVDYKFQNV